MHALLDNAYAVLYNANVTVRILSNRLQASCFSPIGQEYPFLQVSEIFLSRPAVSA